MFGHAVPKKGKFEKGVAVGATIEDVKWLGYTKMMLNIDNEPAILKILVESLRELRIQSLEKVMSENAPEYDLQANGDALVGVQIVKGVFRTHRSGIENELGYRAPARRLSMAWLVRHAASTVT